MGTRTKTSLVVSVILSLLLFFISQNNATAQDRLKIKKFLNSKLIKKGKLSNSEGDYPSAITAFSKSIKREPENLEAYYQLGLIFEDVIHDYDKAISMYKNVVTLYEWLKQTGTEEEIKIFNTLIIDARRSIDRVIRKKYESIEKSNIPVYIIVGADKKILKEPKLFSDSIYRTTSNTNEFRLLYLEDNWYQLNVPSKGSGWINGRNIVKIIRKEKEAIEISPVEKAAQYERFVDLYPDSPFASDAKEKAHTIYYELAKEEDTINGYTMYLKRYPDGKHAKELKLKMNVLTFKDEEFLNDIDRLKAWVHNNPESTLLEKANVRIEELMFAQAKYDKNIISLERYITEYPQGKYIADAGQIIEDLNYEKAKITDTLDSYRKYLDEYPNGKYIDDAIKEIDEKEFALLLNSKDIELLVEHLKSETNEERIELVENRIEELCYKKAYEADNNAEAIKLHEYYLKKYPDGHYTQEAKARIEDLSLTIATKENTREVFSDFISKFPQSKYYQQAIDSIEVLEFNVARNENTIKSYEKFLKTYPNSKYSQKAIDNIEVLDFNVAKDEKTIESYKRFLKKYPNGKFSQSAKSRIEELIFGSVKKAGTVTEYEEFIKKYPESKYSEEARLRIDKLNYEHYRKKDTIKAYKKFVTKYPENRYVNEARQKISQRTSINKPRKRKSGISSGLILFGAVGIFFLVGLTIRLKGNVREKPYLGKEADLTEEPVFKTNPSVEAVITKSCPSCKNVTVPDKLFCIWCDTYIPNPKVGKKAMYSRRLFATAIDPIIPRFLCTIILVMLSIPSGIVEKMYFIFFLWLLSKGITPGKWILKEKVVDKLSGSYPGYWRMFLREVIVKPVSIVAFGLGYPWLWAVWDKNHQMWHDKIAGTVVVNTR